MNAKSTLRDRDAELRLQTKSAGTDEAKTP